MELFLEGDIWSILMTTTPGGDVAIIVRKYPYMCQSNKSPRTFDAHEAMNAQYTGVLTDASEHHALMMLASISDPIT
jgi:hypothetical protein